MSGAGDRAPTPLAAVLAGAAGLAAGEGRPARAFLRGLVAGALVGAAVAGTALVRRRQTGGDAAPGAGPALGADRRVEPSGPALTR